MEEIVREGTISAGQGHRLTGAPHVDKGNIQIVFASVTNDNKLYHFI
jgi:hypothetical protein